MTFGELIATSAPAWAATLVAAGITARLARRHRLDEARGERRREAADDLSDHLFTLRALSDNVLAGGTIDGRDLARAVLSFENSVARRMALLPNGAEHLERSCREALACAFGAPAVVGLDRRAAHHPLEDPDPYWLELASSWLTHAARQLSQWHDHPARARLPVIPFYLWRRNEDPAHPGVISVPVAEGL